MPLTETRAPSRRLEVPFADITGEEGIPFFRCIERVEGPRVWIAGRPVLSLASSDYLGLAQDPRVREAAIAAVHHYGTSCAGSPVLNGYFGVHRQLETELAAFLGQEEVALFASGYQANLGTLDACRDAGGRVLCDRLAHASLLDAVRMARARTLPFAHNDPLAIDDLLASQRADGPGLVVVEGAYSVDGDLADLEAVAAVCARHGARLLVDEAHSVGTVGPGGRGLAATLATVVPDLVLTGTFSKALAATGGFVAGPQPLVNRIRQRSRPLVFSASLAPPNAAAALAALRVLRAEPERVSRVLAAAELLRAELSEAGYRVLGSGTPILAVECANGDLALALWRQLFEHGLFVNAIIPPAVPEGCGRLRLAVNHHLEAGDVARIIEVFRALAPGYRPPATACDRSAR